MIPEALKALEESKNLTAMHVVPDMYSRKGHDAGAGRRRDRYLAVLARWMNCSEVLTWKPARLSPQACGLPQRRRLLRSPDRLGQASVDVGLVKAVNHELLVQRDR